MADPISLIVTPGIVFPVSSSRIGATELNLGANPTVELLADASLGPDFLDLPAVTAALADTVRGRNYLRRSNFWWEDWKQPDGLSCPAGVWTENALEWWARPTGGVMTVTRTEEAPDTSSNWGVQLIGGSGTTAVEYVTWVPSAIGGSLRDGGMVFSIYIYNPLGTSFAANAILLPATTANDRSSASLALTGGTHTCTAGEWTRLQIYFDAGDYALQYGFYIGLTTTALDSALKAMTVAQAQLELATEASPFIRPTLQPDSFANIPVMTDAERVNGGMVVVRMGNGELRLLPAPAALLSPAVLGYNSGAGVPEWIDPDGSMLILSYTGADQIVTVPAGASTMAVHCWGAGAGSNNGRPGGVGGYTWGEFPCTAADQYTAVVGGAGGFITGGTPYGFAGSSALAASGGGLSGLFTGITPVVDTDATRAFIVAGGGGACSYNYASPGSTATAGGNGNDTGSEGGSADFSGIDQAGSANAGGGGYTGGSTISLAGRSGSGYRHVGSAPRPVSTSGAITGTARSTPVIAGQQLIVPGSTGDYYQNAAGQTDKPGLIVIVWNP